VAVGFSTPVVLVDIVIVPDRLLVPGFGSAVTTNDPGVEPANLDVVSHVAFEVIVYSMTVALPEALLTTLNAVLVPPAFGATHVDGVTCMCGDEVCDSPGSMPMIACWSVV